MLMMPQGAEQQLVEKQMLHQSPTRLGCFLVTRCDSQLHACPPMPSRRKQRRGTEEGEDPRYVAVSRVEISLRKRRRFALILLSCSREGRKDQVLANVMICSGPL